MSKRKSGFQDFWPHYLMAHRDRRCRMLHFVGSTGALAGVVCSIGLAQPLWAALGLIFAYGMAWSGHFFVERNRPASFGNPIWSFAGDIRMYALWLSGRLEPALLVAEHMMAERAVARSAD